MLFKYLTWSKFPLKVLVIPKHTMRCPLYYLFFHVSSNSIALQNFMHKKLNYGPAQKVLELAVMQGDITCLVLVLCAMLMEVLKFVQDIVLVLDFTSLYSSLLMDVLKFDFQIAA